MIKLFIPNPRKLIQPFYYKSVLVIPLHSTGFGKNTQNIITENIGKNKIICIYSHPHQAFNRYNDQNTIHLAQMLQMFESQRAAGLLNYIRMDEVIKYV